MPPPLNPPPYFADMEKHSIGAFVEAHIPLQVGGSRWERLSPIKKGLSLVILAWIGVGFVSMIKGMFGRRCGKVGMGLWALKSHSQPIYTAGTYSEVIYAYIDNESDDLRPSSTASFPLNTDKSLKLNLPEGMDGEVVISYLTSLDGDDNTLSAGQIKVESFWIEGEDMSAELGMWSDDLCDSLSIKFNKGSYHRLHLLLPPSAPVPSLSTNLPLRFSNEVTFTHLTLSTLESGRNITGKYNVTRSIEFETLTGDVDVDVYVLPPPSPPKGHGPHHHDHHHDEEGERRGKKGWWLFSGRRNEGGRYHHDHPHGPPSPFPPPPGRHDHPHGPPPPHGPPTPHGPPGHHGPPHHGPPPPPSIFAHSTTGSLTLRIHSPILTPLKHDNVTSSHPPHPKGNFSIPVDISTHTTTGSITIVDKTFVGLFDVGAVNGNYTVNVGDGKEIKIIREKVGETGGMEVGIVKLLGKGDGEKDGFDSAWKDEGHHRGPPPHSPPGRHGPPPPFPPPHGPPGHQDPPPPGPHGPPPPGPPPHGPPSPHGPPGGPGGPGRHGPPPRPGGPGGPGRHGPPPPPPGMSRVNAHTVIGGVKLHL